jgi:hypothetical protein
MIALRRKPSAFARAKKPALLKTCRLVIQTRLPDAYPYEGSVERTGKVLTIPLCGLGYTLFLVGRR